jgi:RNA polymerase sigma-70 factor (ECF subfamily)
MDIPESGAMRMLYTQHGAALWRYACRLTGDTTHAEDVVHETLQRAWQHPEVVNGNERSARAWLFAVARDVITHDRRVARVRNDVISPDGSGPPEGAGSDELNSALDRTLVADAFAQLPAEHRAVVRRAYYYGWSTGEISADLGIADGTVKSRLHDALRTLRQTLQEMGMEQ